MESGLKGRTAVVCGASSGMGLAIAEALTEEGANVAMFARRRQLLEREADRLGALAVVGDLTNPVHLQRLVDETLRAFGSIDVLVNNGGGPAPTTARDVDATSIEEAVELLLMPTIRLTTLCLSHLERSGHGRVITITSSSVKEPIDSLALSNAIRPGIVGWMKTLSREVGSAGVTVNCIAPGRIATARLQEVYGDAGPSEAQLAQIALRRLGDPREIGDVVCFLASDRASYVTGTTIAVDGGLTRGLL